MTKKEYDELFEKFTELLDEFPPIENMGAMNEPPPLAHQNGVMEGGMVYIVIFVWGNEEVWEWVAQRPLYVPREGDHVILGDPTHQKSVWVVTGNAVVSYYSGAQVVTVRVETTDD